MPELSAPELQRIRDALTAKFDAVDSAGYTPAILQQMEEIADLIESVDEPAAVAASGRRASLGDAGRQARAGLKPRNAGAGRHAAELTGRHGKPIENDRQLAEQFADALNRGMDAPRGLKNVVASAHFNFPEDRQLNLDGSRSTERLDAVVDMQSLVAAGGICSPVEVDYSILSVGTADRPLRDGLPQFQADRGGVTYLLPPALTATASGVGIWTNSMDIAAATDPNVKKPRVSLTCGAVNTVLVDAIVERALVGNMQARFQPEMVAALLDTLNINAAHTAELNLLGKIAANSTPVSGARLLGATRDVLATLDQVSSAYRWQQRIPRTVSLTLILPDWVKDMIRADMAREQANSDPLAVTDAQIESWFSVRNLSPIWLLDGLPANAAGIPFAAQGFAAQTSGAALAGWPQQLVFWIFVPGTFVYLNGGTLDVGVVRDADLNAQNNLEMFSETFESVAFRGLASLQVVANVRPNGASAAPVSTSSY
jgi:hypothetical protein